VCFEEDYYTLPSSQRLSQSQSSLRNQRQEKKAKTSNTSTSSNNNNKRKKTEDNRQQQQEFVETESDEDIKVISNRSLNQSSSSSIRQQQEKKSRVQASSSSSSSSSSLLQGYDISNRPIIQPFSNHEKLFIKIFSDKNQSTKSNKLFKQLEQTHSVIFSETILDMKETSIIKYLIIDASEQVKSYIRQGYTRLLTTHLSDNVRPENDFVDATRRVVDPHILASVNTGLVRRHPNEPHVFVFAVRPRTLSNYLLKMGQANKRDKLEEIKEKLQDPEFRRYLNEAKKLWWEINNAEDLMNFYQEYEPYDEE